VKCRPNRRFAQAQFVKVRYDTTFRREAVDSLLRPRVVEKIERAARFKLTVLAAPAGFGKTIALRQFIAAAAAPCTVVALSGVAGVREFALAVARALDPHAPGTLARVTAAARSAPAEPAGALLAALSESVQSLDELIALDGLDAALLSDEAVLRCAIELVQRSGPKVRWLIATRAAGLLPVATWMGYGWMNAPVDERDLCFSRDEAVAVARLIDASAGKRAIDELYAATGGWPTPFVLGLRMAGRADHHAGPGWLASQPMVAEFLTGHVFAELDAEEREFVLATVVLPTIDAELVPRLGRFALRETMERVRRRISLVSFHGSGVFAYHPLLRAFLEHELRGRGEDAYRNALLQAAQAYERGEHVEAALETFVLGGATDDVERTLERHGFELVERGALVCVTAALAALQRAKRAGTPAVLSLRALLESNAGNVARADLFFEQSVAAAGGPDERLELLDRFVLDLLKRNDPSKREGLRGTVARLDLALAAAAQSAPALRAEVLGTLAIAYVTLDKPREAQAAIDTALATIGSDDNPRLQATIYHQASYVAYVAGDAQRGARLASRAWSLALEQRNYRLAVRSASIRYSIAMGLEDDPERAEGFLEEMLSAATIAGDHVLQAEALAGRLDIAAERGDDAALTRIEHAIESTQSGVGVSVSPLAAVKALRAAWEGNFRLAYELVASSAREQGSPLRRALRSAEIAIYAGAAGERDSAAEHVSDALHGARSVALRNAEDRLRQAKTLALCAVAYLVIGNGALANGLLSELERSRREMSLRTRTLVEAVRALYLRIEIGGEEGFAATHERLRGVGYGGLVRLFDVLPLAGGATSSSIGLLTPTEIVVLRIMARGGSSTKMAAELARSVNTVNAHVKSIKRKLACASRQDAVTIARAHGLIR
jgi:LuxR family maltose regulon positive regulatory protein